MSERLVLPPRWGKLGDAWVIQANERLPHDGDTIDVAVLRKDGSQSVETVLAEPEYVNETRHVYLYVKVSDARIATRK